MNADAFFKIGATHRVCQDYAISDQVNGTPFVVVCDGCSAVRNSDIGARLLALHVRPNFDLALLDPEAFLRHVAKSTEVACAAIGQHLDILCATFMFATVLKDKIRVIMVGDGVIAARSRDGNVEFQSWRPNSGAPYYLRYDLDQTIKKGYFEKFGSMYTVEEYNYANRLNSGTFDSKSSQIVVFEPSSIEITGSRSEKLDFQFPYIVKDFPIKHFDIVSLMSDGAASFTTPNKTPTSITDNPVGVAEIVNELMAFKGRCQGEFVQRRCQRAFEIFDKKGWSNYDDVSVAAIHMDEQL